MAEPMVSHDVVAFDLLSERVSQTIRVVQSGQGADEVFAGYHWYPPLAGVAGRRRSTTYASAFFDRDHAQHARRRRPTGTRSPSDPSLAFVRGAHGARRAPRPPWTPALRLDSEIMLVDDPVKRVDNMSMAWGLEARVPFLDHDLVELAAAVPAGAQAGRRRQGRAQGDRPADHPAGGHRPAQGLLPGAGDHPPRGQGARPGARRARPRRRPRPRAVPARVRPASCWPTPTASSRRCGATSSGSWACSSSGCRPTGSEGVTGTPRVAGHRRRTPVPPRRR